MKAMFNLGAFAGGLAQGIRSGQDIQIRQDTAGRLVKADNREAEIHQARMDKAGFNKDKRDRLRAANEEIAAGWGEIRKPRPDNIDVGSNKPGLTSSAAAGPSQKQPTVSSIGGLEPEGSATLENSLAINKAASGLMSQYGKSPLSKNPAVQGMTADEAIGRRILTGNLLDNPDELTRMANIYKKHGLLAEMLPWMNKAYAAKKKRIPDALHFLLAGDAKGAREVLREGGINLAEDPVRINPDGAQGNVWKFEFGNGRERDIDLKDLAVKFFPEDYLDLQTGDQM